MQDPSPHTPNDSDLNRIWSQPPNQPKPSPADPRLHALVHDLDAAWDLPIPFALAPAAQPPRGLQPRSEFVTSGATHPAHRRYFADGYLAFVVHSTAVTERMVCGCDSCGRPGCVTCPPRPDTRPGTTGGAR